MLVDNFKFEKQITIWIKYAVRAGFWLGYPAGFITSGSILFIIYHLMGR